MERSAVYFKPWVGTDYWESPLWGLRVLIVGESHYIAQEDVYPDFTIDCVREQKDGQWTKAFWTHVAVACLGHRPTPEEKLAFWNSVAFYNYIQETVGEEPRVRPTDKMWEDGQRAFAQLLDDLRPEFVLALGYALWDALPELGGRHGPPIAGATQKSTWLYPLKSGSTCLAYGIRHPSSGFSGVKWNVHVRNAMELARSGVAPAPAGSA